MEPEQIISSLRTKLKVSITLSEDGKALDVEPWEAVEGTPAADLILSHRADLIRHLGGTPGAQPAFKFERSHPEACVPDGIERATLPPPVTQADTRPRLNYDMTQAQLIKLFTDLCCDGPRGLVVYQRKRFYVDRLVEELAEDPRNDSRHNDHISWRKLAIELLYAVRYGHWERWPIGDDEKLIPAREWFQKFPWELEEAEKKLSERNDFKFGEKAVALAAAREIKEIEKKFKQRATGKKAGKKAAAKRRAAAAEEANVAPEEERDEPESRQPEAPAPRVQPREAPRRQPRVIR